MHTTLLTMLGIVRPSTTYANGYDPEKYPQGHYANPNVPMFTIDEVKQHTRKETQMWCTFKGGVYDITEFAHGHPGGAGRLAMAGGKDLAIFWDVYRMHYQHHVLIRWRASGEESGAKELLYSCSPLEKLKWF